MLSYSKFDCCTNYRLKGITALLLIISNSGIQIPIILLIGNFPSYETLKDRKGVVAKLFYIQIRVGLTQIHLQLAFFFSLLRNINGFPSVVAKSLFHTRLVFVSATYDLLVEPHS